MSDSDPTPSAAQGHYEGWWFGWCERCLKWRLRVYRWFGYDTVGDSVCWRCKR